MLNIVIPMAGRGSRFWGTEDNVPKPMIQVVPGKAMIEYVIEYLTPPEEHCFIFVCLTAQGRQYNFVELFRRSTRNFQTVWTDEVTVGPAASALLAGPLIDNEDELLVAYCD